MNISDEDFDKIIAGKAGASAPGAGEISRAMRELNSTYVGPTPPATEARHLTAIHQANRSRGAQVKPAVPNGFTVAVLEPLKAFGAGLRRAGVAHLSGATAVWTVVAALFLVGATGGLAAAGALPGPLQSALSQAAASVGFEVPNPNPAIKQVEIADPAGQAPPSAADLAAQQAALESAEQAILAAEQAQKAAQESAAASARCIEASMAQVSTLMDGILRATSQAQAQALVTQARAIGTNVKACSDRATATGQAGATQAAQAALLAQRALEGNPSLSPQAMEAVAAAQKAALTAETSAEQALSVSRSIVDNVSGLTAGLINSTLGLQEALAPAKPAPVPGGAPLPPPAEMTNPTGWANYGMDFAGQIMNSFMGGTGRGR